MTVASKKKTRGGDETPPPNLIAHFVLSLSRIDRHLNRRVPHDLELMPPISCEGAPCPGGGAGSLISAPPPVNRLREPGAGPGQTRLKEILRQGRRREDFLVAVTSISSRLISRRRYNIEE